jgi:hypothetical protein
MTAVASRRRRSTRSSRSLPTHVPRDDVPPLLGRIREWLRPVAC